MGLLADFLGSITGDPSAQPLFNSNGQQGALAQFGNQVTNLAVPAAQRPQAQAQQIQNDQQRAIMNQMAKDRANGASPMQTISHLAAYDPNIALKLAEIKATNPLADFGQQASPQPATTQPTFTGQADAQADASLPWSTANTQPTQGSLSIQTTPTQNTSPPNQQTGVNEAIIDSHPSSIVRTLARAFIYGGKPLPTGTEAKSPYDLAAMDLAVKADPSLVSTGGKTRSATQQSASSGDMYKAETSLNTMTGHLYDMHEAANGLHNTPSPALNWIGKEATNLTGTGLPTAIGGNGSDQLKLSSLYNSFKGKYAPEAAKYFSGGAATDSASAEAEAPFSDTLPVGTIQNNAKGQIGIIKSKADALQQEYNQGMGNAATKQLLHPDTVALMKDMQGLPLTPDEQKMVNQHRVESQLPPKTWNAAAQSPSTGGQQSQARPVLNQNAALAEAHRRGLIK